MDGVRKCPKCHNTEICLWLIKQGHQMLQAFMMTSTSSSSLVVFSLLYFLFDSFLKQKYECYNDTYHLLKLISHSFCHILFMNPDNFRENREPT